MFGDTNTRDIIIVNTKSISGASNGLFFQMSLRVIMVERVVRERSNKPVNASK